MNRRFLLHTASGGEYAVQAVLVLSPVYSYNRISRNRVSEKEMKTMDPRKQETRTAISELIEELDPEDMEKITGGGTPEIPPKSEEKDR